MFEPTLVRSQTNTWKTKGKADGISCEAGDHNIEFTDNMGTVNCERFEIELSKAEEYLTRTFLQGTERLSNQLKGPLKLRTNNVEKVIDARNRLQLAQIALQACKIGRVN